MLKTAAKYLPGFFFLACGFAGFLSGKTWTSILVASVIAALTVYLAIFLAGFFSSGRELKK